MKKSPGIAVLLSILLPGAGSMYSERVGKGIAYLIFTVIGYACLVLPGAIIHICSMVSAYNDAKNFGEVVAGPPKEEPKYDSPWFTGKTGVKEEPEVEKDVNLEYYKKKV